MRSKFHAIAVSIKWYNRCFKYSGLRQLGLAKVPMPLL